MKKILAIVVVLFVGLTYYTSAQDAGGAGATDTNGTQDDPKSYKQTLIDFTQIDPEQDDQLAVLYGDDLALTLPSDELDSLQPLNYGLKNWRVVPSQSIWYPEVLAHSYTKGVTAEAGQYQGQSVLGIRLQFPPYNFDMFVRVKPPFYPDSKDPKFINNGVLKNVGLVKSAYITVYGLYQKEKVYLETEDDDGVVYQYPFGSLDFVGWRELEWVNPSYIEDIRFREIDRRPFYPRKASTRMIQNIVIQRSALYPTTDFVTYIKDISVTYDKDVNDDLFNDFANEETWKIIQDSQSTREQIRLERTTIERYFEYLNARKKYTRAQQNANAGQ